MRCSLCLAENRSQATRCACCAAALDEARHREYQGVVYLLGQVARWGEEGRLPPGTIAALRRDYERRRDGIREALLPPPAPVPEIKIRIIEERPAPRPAAAAPAPVPQKPPPPPFSWKDLLTERNIRWILNLGIFIFSTALAVFIHTQWGGMAPLLKVSILFGASLAAMGAGRLLRRTILKATGMALVVLGALALPIDCAALVRFDLVPSRYADEVGLAGSVLCLAVYGLLARLTSEGIFSVLGTFAAAGIWTFLLRVLGVPWPAVVPWLAPFALAVSCAARGWRPVALAARWIQGGALVLSLGLLVPGLLDARAHGAALEVALASAVAAAWIERRRSGRRAWSWIAMLLLGAMFAVAAANRGLSFFDCWLWLALLGAAFGLGWRWKSLPFIAGSVAAGALALVAARFNFHHLAWALAVPAALHAVIGFARNDGRHAFAGWLLAGLALAAGLEAMGVPRLRQPLHYALFGAAMASLAKVRTRDAFHLLAALGAGTAMVLLAAWYPQYYLFKPAPGGQPEQLLGAAVAAVSALAFGPIANRLRSRFVSDVTYGCVGFAWILALRWAHVPGKWLGLSLALFAVAYVLFEKRIERWLLRPTFFTGTACTVAAAVFASLQCFVWREYLQASLTLLLVGGFYLAAARHTPYKGLAHVGVAAAAAGWLAGLRFLGVAPVLWALLTFLPAGWALMVAARRRDLHLSLASLVASAAALAFVFLDLEMYEKANLPVTIAAAASAAALGGWFAFGERDLPGVHPSAMSGLMGFFASLAYVLFLKYLSKGSPWGGLLVFAMAGALCAAGEALRRRGFERQAWPLAAVSLLVAGAAAFAAHLRGMDEGVHLWIYGLALALYTVAGRAFRREEFSWAGAAAGGAGLVFWLMYWENPWIGIFTFVLAGLGLQRRERPLACLGALAAVACPFHAAWSLGGPEAGVVLLVMTALLACTPLRPLAFYTVGLAAVFTFRFEGWNTAVLFSGFGIFLTTALVLRKPLYVYASLILALAGDYTLGARFQEYAGLAAFPLALVLLAMAWEVDRRFGKEFGRPLLGTSFAAAVLATAFALGHPADRILVLLGDALLFGISAALFRRPELVYPCSAALVGLAAAFMARFNVPRMQAAFWVLTLALAKVVFVRAMGDRLRGYLQPLFVAALVVAAGTVVFGACDPRAALAPGEISWSIWGLVVTAAVFGVAGRIRRIPAFLYLAAANLLGAYYLTLHKYSISTLEFFTVPIGVAMVAWAALAFRELGVRGLVEALATGMLFVPSAVRSFVPGGDAHALAALVLAFLVVLAGMAMKRRVYLFGGTALFVAEVLGKALHFLVRQGLSMAEWGMILGGLMILVAAAFEARKARFLRERLEDWRAGARRYVATLK